MLSQRIKRIRESKTLGVSALAARLRAEGHDVVNLSVGEPDFDTPEHVKQAAIEAIQAGKTKYTPADGTPELKRAIADKLARENGLEYSTEQIIASAGVKPALYNLCQALLDDGDEALIPVPWWVSYPDIVRLAGGEPVFVESGDDFKITPEGLARAITPRTRLLMLNSPSNPSGAVYTRDELQALGEALLEHPRVAIASDDIYEHILLDDEPFASILNACPALADRTVVLNGVSKGYAMTGWRIGYAAGPAEWIAGMKKFQSHSASCPNSIAQAAAREALDNGADFVRAARAKYVERHRALFDALGQIDGVRCRPAAGGFYLFPDFGEVIAARDDVRDDIELAERLLADAFVAVVPGGAFGQPNHLRLSFGCEPERLREGVARIAKLLGL